MRPKTDTMIQFECEGVTILSIFHGYKTFAMSVKSLGYFLHKESPTYYRTDGVIESKYGGQVEVYEEYPKPSVDYICKLFEQVKYDTIVFGPTLEACVYLGRVTNAPVLPTQFLVSAENREHVEKNSNKYTHYIIGHEIDWPRLCVWLKPKNLGELYSRMIEKAKNVIILSSDSGNDNKNGTPRGWKKENFSILDSSNAGSNFSCRIQEPSKAGYKVTNDYIPHWEFSMDNEQITNLENYCSKRGKNVLTIISGDWLGFLPTMLFKKFYEKNNLRPEGITFNSYFVCHPFYETEFLRVPMVHIEYNAEHYMKEFKKLINSIDFSSKTAEYMVWDNLFDRVPFAPDKRLESWGFQTIYKTKRPYDVWCFGWEVNEDMLNPTREWIVPKLKNRKAFRKFKELLSLEEIMNICSRIPKMKIRKI